MTVLSLRKHGSFTLGDVVAPNRSLLLIKANFVHMFKVFYKLDFHFFKICFFEMKFFKNRIFRKIDIKAWIFNFCQSLINELSTFALCINRYFSQCPKMRMWPYANILSEYKLHEHCLRTCWCANNWQFLSVDVAIYSVTNNW